MNIGKHPPGRLRVDGQATTLATSELTAAEHAKFIERRGFSWLKRLLADPQVNALPLNYSASLRCHGSECASAEKTSCEKLSFGGHRPS
jgi:hypothetical protein